MGPTYQPVGPTCQSLLSLSLSISPVFLFTGAAGAALPPAAAYSHRQPARRLGMSRPPLLPPLQLLAPARQHQRRHNGGGGGDEQHRREASGQVRSPPHLAPCPTRLCPTPPHPLTAHRSPRASSPKCHHACLALLSAELYRHPKSATVGEAPRRFPWREASSWPRQPLRCLTPAGQAPELQFADERRPPVPATPRPSPGSVKRPRPRSPMAACAPSVDARQFMVAGRRRCRGPVVAPPQAAAELPLAARARIVWICERRGRRPAEGGVGGDRRPAEGGVGGNRLLVEGGVGGDRRRKLWAATGREMERERERRD